jgi:hypothetical protein
VAENPDTVLQRQIEYFSSDDLLRERARLHRDASPEECLVATAECCELAEAMFAMMEPDVRERARTPEPVPDRILAVLRAMQQ